MFIRFIASSIVAVAAATSAFAQTTGAQGGSSGGTTIAPTPNSTGSGTTRTDPGITNSTINSGAVDLNRSGSTINPRGVNPAIPSSPGCANVTGQQDDAASGTSGLGCPPLPR
ncbi:hypothetical protein [Rhizobium mongolense]|uniref:Uncharacterized protein n=1 Tax=Rhizobium mongolense TaxID=57676 RepID=A0A7W6RQQ8_9HYPH|nr:hypothetical protein [Rhizobium mongolense]MBB4276943.1 hypothetical protein [Rhizobium mongolense]